MIRRAKCDKVIFTCVNCEIFLFFEENLTEQSNSGVYVVKSSKVYNILTPGNTIVCNHCHRVIGSIMANVDISNEESFCRFPLYFVLRFEVNKRLF